MYSITVFVPIKHKERLKESMFNSGAGKYKNYDKCCWEVKGTGQFRPLDKSNPYIGEKNTLKKIEEYRLEMICRNGSIDNVIKTIKKVHPYEEPAYFIHELINF